MNLRRIMRRHLHRILGLFLLVLTISVYWQVQYNDFIHFDDPRYVIENHHVRAGLTKEGFTWAFSTFFFSNWHPLTWLSYMLDFQLYGLNSTGYHLTNLFFHLGNTLLLFLFLRESTGKIWESFLVAGLFALHPLHVESVAWVSERKDVLSAFFWMLTMLFYVRYVRNPGICSYLWSLIFFALGLMAKPMLVTLPFVLLLLDYWPLKRTGIFGFLGKSRAQKPDATIQIQPMRLVWEKVPFFVLSTASSIVTYIAQGRAVQSLNSIPFQARITNALVAYVTYMAKTVWPTDLSIFYPLPVHTTRGWWEGPLSALFLASLCAIALYLVRRYPYLFVGWFWFLGTLIPVIGIVQVGMQSMADRYTYIPLIGLFVAGVWGLSDIIERYKIHPGILALFWGLVISVLMAGTWLQVQLWQDSLLLFQHSLKATKDNYAAHFVLSFVERERGNMEKALFHYKKAVDISPVYVAMAHNRSGYYQAEQGRSDEAMAQFSKALDIRADYPHAHNNLGVVLARKGSLDEAIVQFSRALEIKPDYNEARKSLENALRQREKMRATESGS